MNLSDVLETYVPTDLDTATDAEQFLAAEFAAMEAGKYHPAVRPARYVAADADPSVEQYDRAIASLSPPESGKPTLH